MRFRVEAFLPRLRAAGHQVQVSTFFGDQSPRILRGLGRRLFDMLRARAVGRILIHREAFPLANNDYVRLLGNVPMVFDFDDPVYLPSHSGLRRLIARPHTTRLLVERASVVYAGSPVLAEYAERYSSRVRLVPTVVDTDRFVPVDRERGAVIGWIGSPWTAKYLSRVVPALERLARERTITVRFVGAGAAAPVVRGVKFESFPWRLEDEVAAFQGLDVGIYPLEDDEWSRGKCGFKAIQFMSCGVPFVVSPVGAIQSVVRDGTDGLFARTSDEWYGNLRHLLEDREGARQLARNARWRAIERFSVRALADNWIRGVVSPGAEFR